MINNDTKIEKKKFAPKGRNVKRGIDIVVASIFHQKYTMTVQYNTVTGPPDKPVYKRSKTQ